MISAMGLQGFGPWSSCKRRRGPCRSVLAGNFMSVSYRFFPELPDLSLILLENLWILSTVPAVPGNVSYCICSPEARSLHSVYTMDQTMMVRSSIWGVLKAWRGVVPGYMGELSIVGSHTKNLVDLYDHT